MARYGAGHDEISYTRNLGKRKEGERSGHDLTRVGEAKRGEARQKRGREEKRRRKRGIGEQNGTLAGGKGGEEGWRGRER